MSLVCNLLKQVSDGYYQIPKDGSNQIPKSFFLIHINYIFIPYIYPSLRALPRRRCLYVYNVIGILTGPILNITYA